MQIELILNRMIFHQLKLEFLTGRKDNRQF
jgi:hypothetical protein